MTTPTYDDRAAAYVGAREALKAAQKLKVDRKNRVVEPLPELYWALLAEAAVLADLARADAQVGLLAGGYLVDQQRRIEKNRNYARLVAETVATAQQRHPHRAAADAAVTSVRGLTAGHRVRLSRGDWAGRVGEVVNVLVGSVPAQVDVMLAAQVDAGTGHRLAAQTITVPASDIEFMQ